MSFGTDTPRKNQRVARRSKKKPTTIGEVFHGDKVRCANGVVVHVTGAMVDGALRLGRIQTACADCGAASPSWEPVWSEATDIPTSWRVAEVL